jgi:hypothetical protein
MAQVYSEDISGGYRNLEFSRFSYDDDPGGCAQTVHGIGIWAGQTLKTMAYEHTISGSTPAHKSADNASSFGI